MFMNWVGCSTHIWKAYLTTSLLQASWLGGFKLDGSLCSKCPSLSIPKQKARKPFTRHWSFI